MELPRRPDDMDTRARPRARPGVRAKARRK